MCLDFSYVPFAFQQTVFTIIKVCAFARAIVARSRAFPFPAVMLNRRSFLVKCVTSQPASKVSRKAAHNVHNIHDMANSAFTPCADSGPTFSLEVTAQTSSPHWLQLQRVGHSTSNPTKLCAIKASRTSSAAI